MHERIGDVHGCLWRRMNDTTWKQICPLRHFLKPSSVLNTILSLWGTHGSKFSNIPNLGGDATQQGDHRLELSLPSLQLQGQRDMGTHSLSPRSFQLEVWGTLGCSLVLEGLLGMLLPFKCERASHHHCDLTGRGSCLHLLRERSTHTCEGLILLLLTSSLGEGLVSWSRT